MKISTKNSLLRTILLLTCLFGCNQYAQAVPPLLPPAEGVPIDEHLFVLLFAAVLFGIYIVYNHKLNKKRPI